MCVYLAIQMRSQQMFRRPIHTKAERTSFGVTYTTDMPREDQERIFMANLYGVRPAARLKVVRYEEGVKVDEYTAVTPGHYSNTKARR